MTTSTRIKITATASVTAYRIRPYYNGFDYIKEDVKTVLTTADGTEYIYYGRVSNLDEGKPVEISFNDSERVTRAGQIIIKRPKVLGIKRQPKMAACEECTCEVVCDLCADTA